MVQSDTRFVKYFTRPVFWARNFTHQKCIKFQQFQCKITFVECRSCTFTKILQESALLSQIYTDGTNFTRPPVATVVTNLNSGCNFFLAPHQTFQSISPSLPPSLYIAFCSLDDLRLHRGLGAQISHWVPTIRGGSIDEAGESLWTHRQPWSMKCARPHTANFLQLDNYLFL